MEKKELPMYKDKPYNYAGSRKHRPFYRQKRVISGAIFMVIGLAYWFGIFSPSAVKPKLEDSKKSAWNWLSSSTASTSVDWDDRREKVKEAFMLSWDGYEQYAWGTLSCHILSLEQYRLNEALRPRGNSEPAQAQYANDHVLQASMSIIPFQRQGNRWMPKEKAWAGSLSMLWTL